MCGSSAKEQSAQESEKGFMTTLMSNYNQNEALQGATLAHINSVLQPTLEAGPNQTGFSPEESSALNTQAIDTTGAAAANAERAAQTQAAGRNDSGNLPQSGVDQAIEAQTRTASANQLSNEQLGITEADYGTGRSNFNQPRSGEDAIAGMYNPNAAASAANTANQTEFGESQAISQENNQVWSDIAGGIVNVATLGLAGGFGNLDQTGGSTGGEQAKNFASGFLGAF